MRPYTPALLLAILAALFAAPWASAEETPEPAPGIQVDLKLPSSAVARITRYNADLTKLRAQVYADLGQEEITATKAGNLDAALAVRAKRAEFAPAPGSPGTPVATTPASTATPAVPDVSKYTYETVPSREVVIAASSPRNIVATLRDDQVMYVWVKPGERWSTDGVIKVDPLQGDNRFRAIGGIPSAALSIYVGDASGCQLAEKTPYAGPGEVNIRMNDTGFGDNTGQIHIKAMIVKKPAQPATAPAVAPSRF